MALKKQPVQNLFCLKFIIEMSFVPSTGLFDKCNKTGPGLEMPPKFLLCVCAYVRALNRLQVHACVHK